MHSLDAIDTGSALRRLISFPFFDHNLEPVHSWLSSCRCIGGVEWSKREPAITAARPSVPHDQPTHIAEFYGRGALIDDPVLYTSRKFPWMFINSSFTMLGAGNAALARLIAVASLSSK